jgi:hypothetical protein
VGRQTILADLPHHRAKDLAQFTGDRAVRRRLTLITEIIALSRTSVNALAADDIDLRGVPLSNDPTCGNGTCLSEIRFSFEVLPSFRRRIKVQSTTDRTLRPSIGNV